MSWRVAVVLPGALVDADTAVMERLHAPLHTNVYEKHDGEWPIVWSHAYGGR